MANTVPGMTFEWAVVVPYAAPQPVLSRGYWYEAHRGATWHRCTWLAYWVGRLCRCDGLYVRVD